MATKTYIVVGGARKLVDTMYIVVGGARKAVDKLYLVVGGARKLVYQAAAAYVGTLTNITVNSNPATSPARAGFRINSDGTVDTLVYSGGANSYTPHASSTDWIIPNGSASADFDVRVQAGGTFGGGISDWTSKPIADGSWVSVSGNPEWYIEDTAHPGLAKTAVVTLELRDSDGVTSLDTCTVDLTANYSTT